MLSSSSTKSREFFEGFPQAPTKRSLLNSGYGSSLSKAQLEASIHRYPAPTESRSTMTNPLGIPAKPPEEKGNGDGPTVDRPRLAAKQTRGSRLDKMQAQFRHKLEREKESKLLEIYEKNRDNEDKRIERITGGVRGLSSGGDEASVPSNAGMLQEFFKERRMMVAKSGDNKSALPPIQAHLKKKRSEYQLRGPQPSQQGPSQPPTQPLQPQRRAPTQRVNPFQPHLHRRAPTKSNPLSPLNPTREQQRVDYTDDQTRSKGFNDTYSVSGAALKPPSAHAAPPSPFEPPHELRQFAIGNDASDLEVSEGDQIRRDVLPSVGRAASALQPNETEEAEIKFSPSTTPPRDVVPEAITAENRKFLNNIIKTGRLRSARRRQARAAKGTPKSDSTPTQLNPTAKRSNSETFRNDGREEAVPSRREGVVNGITDESDSRPSVDLRARTKNLRRRASPKRDVADVDTNSRPSNSSSPPQFDEYSGSYRVNQEDPYDEETPAVAGKGPVSSAIPTEDAPLPNLVPCGNCGRRFAEERVEKHELACAKQKPRKPYETKRHRVMGQDHANYALNDKLRKEPPKKVSNWRAKHEAFLRQLRSAQQGGTSDEPPTVNPDYVLCPHCGRHFNESAAERHIPRCQDLKTKSVSQRVKPSSNSAKTIAPPSKSRRR